MMDWRSDANRWFLSTIHDFNILYKSNRSNTNWRSSSWTWSTWYFPAECHFTTGILWAHPIDYIFLPHISILQCMVLPLSTILYDRTSSRMKSRRMNCMHLANLRQLSWIGWAYPEHDTGPWNQPSGSTMVGYYSYSRNAQESRQYSSPPYRLLPKSWCDETGLIKACSSIRIWILASRRKRESFYAFSDLAQDFISWSPAPPIVNVNGLHRLPKQPKGERRKVKASHWNLPRRHQILAYARWSFILDHYHHHLLYQLSEVASSGSSSIIESTHHGTGSPSTGCSHRLRLCCSSCSWRPYRPSSVDGLC